MRTYFYYLATDQTRGALAALLKTVLWFLSLIYKIVVAVTLLLYRAGVLPKSDLGHPVISIGNITWGGAGKTPLVEFVAAFLQQRGHKVAVLTRGYMPEGRGGEGHIPDEPGLLRESLPGVAVVATRDRVAGARKASKDFEPDVFVLDDGFQHWKVKRNMDVVLIDSTNPFGNGELIPRGILREPLSSLARADAVVLSKTDRGRDGIPGITARIRAVNPRALIAESVHEPVFLQALGTAPETDLKFLHNKPVVAFCGIGDPESFRHSLEQLGAEVKKLFVFMDHHHYDSADIRRIVRFCRDNKIETVVTTQKDAVKLKELAHLFDGHAGLLSLKIRLQITQGKDEFCRRISALLAR